MKFLYNCVISIIFISGISLFERMVRNNIKCHTLNVQHRMRPEISSLIRPSIYENLIDHSTTENRKMISGIFNRCDVCDISCK